MYQPALCVIPQSSDPPLPPSSSPCKLTPPSLPLPPASCRFSAPLVLGHLWAHASLTLRTHFCVFLLRLRGLRGLRGLGVQSSWASCREVSTPLTPAGARALVPPAFTSLFARKRWGALSPLDQKKPPRASDSSAPGLRPAPTSRIPDLGLVVGDGSVWEALFRGCLGGRVCALWERAVRVCVCSLSLKLRWFLPGVYLPSAALWLLNYRCGDFTAPERGRFRRD